MSRVPHPTVPSFGKRAAALGITFSPAVEEDASDILDNVKLFATGWLGGLVFFGTFLA